MGAGIIFVVLSEFPIERSRSADQCADVHFCHVERAGACAAKTNFQ